MSKNHQRKQAVSWQLAGAVAGGLLVYGTVRLCRRLAALPKVQRAARFLGTLFESTPKKAAAETVFQAESGAEPSSWAPPRGSLYGPN
ncbi:MAG TPA: hypothetical protein PLW65_02950 [Pseudomonadota bacterium]|nr:hypothetical protein [Pseudomonadota bacterium]